jgi:PHD/YefM family antitoxin component YafN of YafNO toxin-antitoxin module
MALAKEAHQARSTTVRRKAVAKGRKVVIKHESERLEGLRETAFLLSNPKNAARLRSALAQAKAGKLVERELDE